MKKKNSKLKLNRETISKMGMSQITGGAASQNKSACISGTCDTSCCPTYHFNEYTCAFSCGGSMAAGHCCI